MKNVYCSKCDDYTDANVIKKEEVFEVKNEKTKIMSNVLVCSKCGEDIFNEEIDERNLELAYSEYRKGKGLLFPSEIRNIRKKYGLSQRLLSKLLDWGEITINRYENGAIQDSAHNEVLQFISEPENMKTIYEKNSNLIPENYRMSFKKRIDKLLEKKKGLLFINSWRYYLSMNESIDIYTGFKKFDIDKMFNMILYVLNKLNGCYKTKINKLLWYIDFLHFKEYSISISGCSYRRIPLGPVPEKYDMIFCAMKEEDFFEEDEKNFVNEKGEDLVAIKFMPLKSFEVDYFNNNEMKVMDFVINKFKDFSAKQIAEYSHEENPFKKTKEKEIISYELSSELSLSL